MVDPSKLKKGDIIIRTKDLFYLDVKCGDLFEFLDKVSFGISCRSLRTNYTAVYHTDFFDYHINVIYEDVLTSII